MKKKSVRQSCPSFVYMLYVRISLIVSSIYACVAVPMTRTSSGKDKVTPQYHSVSGSFATANGGLMGYSSSSRHITSGHGQRQHYSTSRSMAYPTKGQKSGERDRDPATAEYTPGRGTWTHGPM